MRHFLAPNPRSQNRPSLLFVPSLKLGTEEHSGSNEFPPRDWASMPIDQRRTQFKAAFLSTRVMPVHQGALLNLGPVEAAPNFGEPAEGTKSDVVKAFLAYAPIHLQVQRITDYALNRFSHAEFPVQFALIQVSSLILMNEQLGKKVLGAFNGRFWDVGSIPGLSFSVGYGDRNDYFEPVGPAKIKPEGQEGYNLVLKLDLLEFFRTKR